MPLSLPRVVICPDVPRLDDAVASRIAALVAVHTDRARAFRLALAGGRTPRSMHAQLARQADLDWSAVELCFGDERLVPPDDPRSNFAMARESLLDALPNPPRRVIRIRGELQHDLARSVYETDLGDSACDLVILGVGDDGHVASLFPGTPESDPKLRVVATTSPVPPHERVSLSYRALSEARHILVVATGLTKSAPLARAWDEIRASRPVLPVARVALREHPWEWYLDAAAASALVLDREEVSWS